jgi:hypothetical protein
MAYEMKDGDISLFRNEKKQPGSNQPDMRGSMVWRGEKIKISMWTKGEGTRRFLAGKVDLDNYTQSAPQLQVESFLPELPPSEAIQVEPEPGLPF